MQEGVVMKLNNYGINFLKKIIARLVSDYVYEPLTRY